MKYIIQPGIEIGNPENETINVLTSEEVSEYRNKGFECRERTYPITFKNTKYEVVCIEIWKKGEKEHSLVMPAFLLPHRGYPTYVYAYAINLYSGNPGLGQRTVAEETRIKYGLETFAHTTVGRAMKALAQTLTEAPAIDREAMENTVRETGQNEANNNAIDNRRFPTVQDTSATREIVKSFFYEKLKSRCQQWFIEACDLISIYWYSFFQRLFMNTAPGLRRKLFTVIQDT